MMVAAVISRVSITEFEFDGNSSWREIVGFGFNTFSPHPTQVFNSRKGSKDNKLTYDKIRLSSREIIADQDSAYFFQLLSVRRSSYRIDIIGPLQPYLLPSLPHNLAARFYYSETEKILYKH
jgi:hypothetical protein